MKKGQAELFGLIIIVILLIFALLFFVKTQQDDKTSVTVRSNFRANNLLNAIVSLDTPGESVDNMKDWLKKCVDNDPNFDCDRLKIILNEIFKETLLGSEKAYFKTSDNFDLTYGGTCDEGISASPVRLPDSYTFSLRLCS